MNSQSVDGTTCTAHGQLTFAQRLGLFVSTADNHRMSLPPPQRLQVSHNLSDRFPAHDNFTHLHYTNACVLLS